MLVVREYALAGVVAVEGRNRAFPVLFRYVGDGGGGGKSSSGSDCKAAIVRFLVPSFGYGTQAS